MHLNYFTNPQISLFIISAILVIASIISFHQDKKSLAIILLILASLGLGFFIAILDPFLNLWDEQYHALVAKNMIDNPFRPALYSNPVLEYDYKNWTANHIWLHKQPLFLWQMSLSLKLFGINELAARIPSIILHALMVPMIFRIGKIATKSQVVGFYGALFFSLAYFPLELIAGKYSTDHNDVAFLFYVTAGFWAWFEYQNSKKKYWLILIGVFSGAAVLVKWLTGLLIYAVWFFTLGADEKLISRFITPDKDRVILSRYFHIQNYIPLILSSFIAFVIFIPWQIYIYLRFPEEALHEIGTNSIHFFEPVENHSGSFWFHFDAINDLYGAGFFVPFLLVSGLFLLIKNSQSKIYQIAIISAILVTYGFFSLAATKMLSYTIVVAPFICLGLAVLTDAAFSLIKKIIKANKSEKYLRMAGLVLICWFLLDFSKIELYHTNKVPHNNKNRIADINQMLFIEKLNDELGEGEYVVFNADLRMGGHIPVMFYTDHVAYGFIPDKMQIEKIKSLNYKIAILDKGDLPEFIRQDASIMIIQLP
jgi:4-amino-4-deoxy-L-arabinose transferase